MAKKTIARVGRYTVEKNTPIDATEPDIEDYSSGNSEEVLKFVLSTYDDCERRHESRLDIWRKNRDAYEGEDVDLWGGAATVRTDKDEEAFGSTLLPDEIHAIVATQMRGNPRVYPQPVINTEGFEKHADPVIVQPLLESGMSSEEIVRRYWEAIVDDYIERDHINEKRFIMGVDGRLEGLKASMQHIEFNDDIQANDVKRTLFDNRYLKFDPAAKSELDMRYYSIDTFPTLFEAKREWSKHKRDIIKTEEKNVDKSKSEEEDEHKDRVKVVIMYFRDNTTHKVPQPPIQTTDPVTGEPYMEPQPDAIERKYPSGRVIKFIPDLNILLEDEPNEYPWFNIALFVPTPTSRSIYGKALATPLRPLQALHSVFWQQMTANVVANANTQTLYKEGALIDPENDTNAIGLKIPVRRLSDVDRQPARAIIGDIGNAIAMVEDRAKKISGIYESSQGKLPASGTSGRTVLALQAGAEQMTGPTRNQDHQYMYRAWKQTLDLMLITYKKGRMIRMKEEDNLPPMLPFNLVDVTASIDCTIGDEAHFPADPISRLEFAVQMMQMKDGFGVPLGTAEFVYEFLNIPGKKKLLASRQAEIDHLKEQREQAVQGINAPQTNTAQRGPGSTTSANLTQGEIASAAANPAVEA